MSLKKQMLYPSTPPHPPSSVIGFTKTLQINCSEDWIAHSQLNRATQKVLFLLLLFKKKKKCFLSVCGGVLYKFGQ